MFKKNIRYIFATAIFLIAVGGLLYYLINDRLDMYADTMTNTVTDTVPPILNEVRASANGILTVGDSAWVTFTFSESIRTSGNLVVSFNSGGNCNLSISNLSSGSCNYQVLSGQNADKLQVTKITGTIIDMSGNSAQNPMPIVNIQDTIKVDTSPPRITSVAAYVGNDNYVKAGDEIEIGLRFSKNVSSTGSIKINMNVGSGCSFTAINSSYGSCKYTILAGENTPSLNVSGITGVIKDKAGIAMTNFSPMKNISDEKTVAVDTIIPQLLSAAPDRTSGFAKLNDSLKINFKISEPSYNGLVIFFNNGSNCYVNFSSSTTSSCTIKFTSNTKNVSKLMIDRTEGTIHDAAGNSIQNPVFQQGIELFASIGIDLLPPTFSLTSPQESSGIYYGSISTYENVVRLIGSVNDDLSGLAYIKYNNNNLAGPGFYISLATPKHGYYPVEMEAQDKAGNTINLTYDIYRGYGNNVCNPENTLYKPLSLTTIKVPIWKFNGKKIKVKVVTYKTVYSRVKKRTYDKKKHKFVTRWVTVKKKKKITRWVWVSKPKSSKQIVSSTMNLKVNSKCADVFRNIFNQVYNSPDRQIINPAETACYRKNKTCYACRHDYGLACDINVSQNAAFRNGVPYAGSFWKPGSKYSNYYGWSGGFDILSIPPDGAMARAFEANNFGGQLGGDYMHFSIDGW